MSLSAIDLPTNKSATIVDDDRRKIRQSEKGLILSVIIQNANNSSYDLTGKTIQFNEMKDGCASFVKNNDSCYHKGNTNEFDPFKTHFFSTK